MRAAAWLTLKESRASFLIEREADQTDRVKRFAHVMAEHCGKLDEPLGAEELAVLQKGILGTEALRLGVRRSPVFVGQATLRGTSFTISARISRHWAACWRAASVRTVDPRARVASAGGRHRVRFCLSASDE